MNRFSNAFRSEAHTATAANPMISFVFGAAVTAGALLLLMGGAIGGGQNAGDTELRSASGQPETLPTLFTLAKSGTAERVRRAIRSGEFVNAVCPGLIFDLPRGCSPLMVAARFGRADNMAELRRGGALLNARAQNGWTALHVAAAFGQMSAVENLALASDDLEIAVPMRGGMTATELARAVGNFQCADRIAAIDRNLSGVVSSDGEAGAVVVNLEVGHNAGQR